jgi:hypothetical protein
VPASARSEIESRAELRRHGLLIIVGTTIGAVVSHTLGWIGQRDHPDAADRRLTAAIHGEGEMTVAPKVRDRSQAPGGRWPFLLAVVAGAALGVFSIVADGVVGGRLFVILGNLASPWGLAAFLVGLRATSLLRGLLAGGLTLLVGVGTYYVGVAIRGYVLVEANVAWTVVAAVAGPIMGLCGAAISSRRMRPPVAAVAAPASMLVAEASFFVIDRRIWLYDLQAEPYRLIDLAVVVAFLAAGLALPALLVSEGRRRVVAYLMVAAVATCGAFGFVLLHDIIVGIA